MDDAGRKELCWPALRLYATSFRFRPSDHLIECWLINRYLVLWVQENREVES